VSGNAELVRRSFEAIGAWDIDALLELYHPEVEFLPLTGTQVETGGYRGHDGVRAYLAEARDLWDVLEPHGHDYRDLGDRVVVSGTCRVRGRASGAESEPACAWLIGLRDGLIVSHRTCSSLEDAEKFAGVDEPAAIARRLIDSSSYLTLGTADADGRPWVSPVWYAAESHRELLWVSSPEARHSRNLSERPETSIVIFDSRAAPGTAQAVYMSARAGELANGELERAIEAFSRGSQRSGARAWSLDDVVAPARLRLYRATAFEVFVLDSIGDTRQGDHRIPVEL
jgi:ketosteroid isomerase-like protein/nitroimidazol reductase NimA-like FMN-containing flavoprotein (pyridoxamine 5'-phosphate oxidase superfamily)